MGENFYRGMFFVGSIWNVGGGVFIILATGWIFSSANLAPPDPSVYYYSWIALFMVFGLGYYMGSRDLYGNKNIALLGMIGKLAFAAIFIVGMVTAGGQIPPFFWIPVVGDIVFAILHWMFLRFARRMGK